MIDRFEAGTLGNFRLSPNLCVVDIEQALGIKFTSPPARIEWSLRNKLTALADLVYPRRYTEIGQMCFAGLLGFNWSGKAILEDGIYLDEAKEPLTGYHENLHFYIDQVNPRLKNIPQLGENPDIIITLTGTGLVQDCFIEGMAEWGAIRTCLQLGNEELKLEAIQSQDSHLTRVNASFEKLFHASHLLETARTNGFKASSNENEEKTFSEMWYELKTVLKMTSIDLRAARMQFSARYDVGYHFCFFAMKALKLGRPIPEAMDLLLLNPPTALEHLRNPEHYARSLI